MSDLDEFFDDCVAPDCDDEPTVSIAISGDATVRKYCLHHGQQEHRRLEAQLITHQVTSLARTEPNDADKLGKAYGDLQKQHEELIGSRKAVERLERMWNEADQERQALKVSLQRSTDKLLELAQENARLVGELAAAHDRLQALEVEPLAGVDAGTDPNGPTSKVEGGEHAAES